MTEQGGEDEEDDPEDPEGPDAAEVPLRLMEDRVHGDLSDRVGAAENEALENGIEPEVRGLLAEQPAEDLVGVVAVGPQGCWKEEDSFGDIGGPPAGRTLGTEHGQQLEELGESVGSALMESQFEAPVDELIVDDRESGGPEPAGDGVEAFPQAGDRAEGQVDLHRAVVSEGLEEEGVVFRNVERHDGLEGAEVAGPGAEQGEDLLAGVVGPPPVDDGLDQDGGFGQVRDDGGFVVPGGALAEHLEDEAGRGGFGSHAADGIEEQVAVVRHEAGEVADGRRLRVFEVGTGAALAVEEIIEVGAKLVGGQVGGEVSVIYQPLCEGGGRAFRFVGALDGGEDGSLFSGARCQGELRTAETAGHGAEVFGLEDEEPGGRQVVVGECRGAGGMGFEAQFAEGPGGGRKAGNPLRVVRVGDPDQLVGRDVKGEEDVAGPLVCGGGRGRIGDGVQPGCAVRDVGREVSHRRPSPGKTPRAGIHRCLGVEWQVGGESPAGGGGRDVRVDFQGTARRGAVRVAEISGVEPVFRACLMGPVGDEEPEAGSVLVQGVHEGRTGDGMIRER